MKLRGRVFVLALLDSKDDVLLGKASHQDIGAIHLTGLVSRHGGTSCWRRLPEVRC
jgi:hypothetical protein